MGWSKNAQTCVPAFGMSVFNDFQIYNNDIGKNIDFCCNEPHLWLSPTQSTQVIENKYVLEYCVNSWTWEVKEWHLYEMSSLIRQRLQHGVLPYL